MSISGTHLPSPPGRDEPRASLHSIKWRAARLRVGALDVTRPLFAAMLDHVENGWEVLRPLQHWCEENEPLARDGQDDYAHLLSFMNGELADVFLLIGAGVADLVPGWENWIEEADPMDLDGWTETFGRYLVVFRMACAGADVPASFRAMALDAAAVLERGRWSQRMAALLAEVGEWIPEEMDLSEGGR